jgi:hypothetical protein
LNAQFCRSGQKAEEEGEFEMGKEKRKKGSGVEEKMEGE